MSQAMTVLKKRSRRKLRIGDEPRETFSRSVIWPTRA